MTLVCAFQRYSGVKFFSVKKRANILRIKFQVCHAKSEPFFIYIKFINYFLQLFYITVESLNYVGANFRGLLQINKFVGM